MCTTNFNPTIRPLLVWIGKSIVRWRWGSGSDLLQCCALPRIHHDANDPGTISNSIKTPTTIPTVGSADAGWVGLLDVSMADSFALLIMLEVLTVALVLVAVEVVVVKVVKVVVVKVVKVVVVK